jgi:hypothetical protein
MLTSGTWWVVVIGGACLGFGFAAGSGLFQGIVSLFRSK